MQYTSKSQSAIQEIDNAINQLINQSIIQTKDNILYKTFSEVYCFYLAQVLILFKYPVI